MVFSVKGHNVQISQKMVDTYKKTMKYDLDASQVELYFLQGCGTDDAEAIFRSKSAAEITAAVEREMIAELKEFDTYPG